MLQTPKKQKEHAKHQKKNIMNEKQTPNKTQKPERAPERQNRKVRQANLLPSKSPTGQQFFSVSILKKKMNQSAFLKKKLKSFYWSRKRVEFHPQLIHWTLQNT